MIVMHSDRQLRSGPDGSEEDALNDLAAPQELYLAEHQAGGGLLPGGRRRPLPGACARSAEEPGR